MEKLQQTLRNHKSGWVVWPVWTVACFLAASYVFGFLIIGAFKALGLVGLIANTNGALILQTIIYLMALGLIFSLRYVRKTTTKETLGVQRPMKLGDIGLGVAGYIIYFIILVGVTMLLTNLVPAYVADQPQDVGFTSLFGLERLIGFFVFVVVAPIVEEVIMRGFLYGKLRQAKMPMWPAAVIVSVIFGVLHGQWNVAVDTFILSMVACYLREVTGTIWPGVVIHMTKNAVAFTLLFIVMIPG